MLFCDHPTLDVWTRDFSTSGLANPTWTRAKCGEVELCNSLNALIGVQTRSKFRSATPAVLLGAPPEGYVHISILKDVVLWTMPQREKSEALEGKLFPASCVARFRAVAFPKSVWTSFHEAAIEVPEPEALPSRSATLGSTVPRGVQSTMSVIGFAHNYLQRILWTYRLRSNRLNSG